ncbi:MAG: SDR family oxidoreductase [Cupriavidus sp.]|nr:MAG: SDR family oxidoreductase [Cupriavidus sp.]
MRIVVIGGTGLVGTKTVARLRGQKHDVVAASPSKGVNAITGEGLSKAMAGADVVIDLSNPPTFDRKAVREFFETSSRNILSAGTAAGVRHHIVLSIVGVDRVPGQDYYSAKVAQERLITASGVPYTIVRSTQFLEFLGTIADASTDGCVVRVPPGFLQPVAADDVAAFVAEVTVGDPTNGTVEIAGPERSEFSDFVARYLATLDDPRRVVTDVRALYFGGRLDELSLVPLVPARLGRIGFEEWASRSLESV